MKNENGFSLIELAVSCAIISVLGGIGLITLSAQANSLIEKAEEIQAAQEFNLTN